MFHLHASAKRALVDWLGVRIASMSSAGNVSTHAFVNLIGVSEVAPSTSAFDPGYDPITLEAHLQQSHQSVLMRYSWLVCAITPPWRSMLRG